MADGRVRLDALLRRGRERLTAAGVAQPGLDTRLLVEHFSGLDRVRLISDPASEVEADIARSIEDAFRRRASGEPVHRIIGWREFYGLRLALSPDTLEPRPDTETLVDALLPFVRETADRKGTCDILDLGTGSGAIALAFLAQVTGATATGVDIAPGAVAAARRNAVDNGLADRFTATASDWFAAISGRWDLIVSNPPYISSAEMADLPPEVRDFDPLLALHGGADGLDAYRRIALGASHALEPGGRVGVEIGYDQRQAIVEIFIDAGYELVASRRDLGGHERTLVFAVAEAKPQAQAPEIPLGKPGDCR